MSDAPSGALPFNVFGASREKVLEKCQQASRADSISCEVILDGDEGAVRREQELEENHKRLASRYLERARDRGDTMSGYVLEHGLSPLEVNALERSVGEHLKDVGVSAAFWRRAPLPLVVVSSQAGYDYKGAGTKFWARLSARLGDEGLFAGGAARATLSALFESCSKEYSFTRPADTPWARQFNLIAWPITNALLPREVQWPFAQLLDRLTPSITYHPLDEIHAVMKRHGNGLAGSRFDDWLERPCAPRLVYDLLAEAPRYFDPSLVKALEADICEYAEASRMIDRARARQARVSIQRSEDRGRSAYLLAAVDGDRVGFWLSMSTPPAPEELKATLRRAFMMPRPWDGARAASPNEVIGGFPIDLGLCAWPAPDTALFPELRSAPLSQDNSTWVHGLDVDVSLPALFVRRGDDSFAPRYDVGVNLQGAKCVFVCRARSVIAPARARPLEVGALVGVNAFELDLRRKAHRRWLKQHARVEVSSGSKSSLIAPPPLNPSLALYQKGDAIGARAQDEHGARLFLIDGSACKSKGVIEVRGLGLSYRVEEDSRYDLATMHLEEASGARAKALAPLSRGEVSMRIEGPLPLSGLSLHVRLSCEALRCSYLVPVAALPACLDCNAWLWDNLSAEEAKTLRADINARHVVNVTASIAGLSEASWMLEAAMNTHWWTARGPETDAGDLSEVVLQRARGVLLTNLTSAPQVPHDAGVVLRLAQDGTTPRLWGGRCEVRGRAIRLSSGYSEGELRGFEEAAARRDHRTFGELSRAYLAWALADSVDLPAELVRLGATQTLEDALVAYLCGLRWLQHERLQRGTPWRRFTRFCCGIEGGRPALSLAGLPRRLVRQLADEIVMGMHNMPFDLDAQRRQGFGEAFAEIVWSSAERLMKANGRFASALGEVDVMVPDARLFEIIKSVSSQRLLDRLKPHAASVVFTPLAHDAYSAEELASLIGEWSRIAKVAAPWSPELLLTALTLWLDPDRYARGHVACAEAELLAATHKDPHTARAVRCCALMARAMRSPPIQEIER